VSSSLSVVVLFSDISRALYRVLVGTFPEFNLLFMGRGTTSQAQQHQISVANNRLSERACGALWSPACPLELQTRCAYLARKHHNGICSSICSCTRPCMPFSCHAYECVHIFTACGAHFGSCLRRLFFLASLILATRASPSSYNKGCKQALPPSLSPSNEVFCVLKFLPFLPLFLSIYIYLVMLWDASGKGMRT
jgi:hypothetical protein